MVASQKINPERRPRIPARRRSTPSAATRSGTRAAKASQLWSPLPAKARASR